MSNLGDDLSGGFGSGGMPDMNELLSQAMKMQEQLQEAQRAAAEQVVEGVSGGGVVRVTAMGDGRFTRVRIDPKVVDPSDVSMLEDLILAAVHDAAMQVAELNQEAMGGLSFGGGLGGLLG
jgi:nucleoid-associated protein EbfC